MKNEKNLVTVPTLEELLIELMKDTPTEKEYMAQRKSQNISAGIRLEKLRRVHVSHDAYERAGAPLAGTVTAPKMVTPPEETRRKERLRKN